MPDLTQSQPEPPQQKLSTPQEDSTKQLQHPVPPNGGPDSQPRPTEPQPMERQQESPQREPETHQTESATPQNSPAHPSLTIPSIQEATEISKTQNENNDENREQKCHKAKAILIVIAVFVLFLLIAVVLAYVYLDPNPINYFVKKFNIAEECSANRGQCPLFLFSPLTVIVLALYQILEIPENLHTIYLSIAQHTIAQHKFKFTPEFVMSLLKLLLNSLLIAVSIVGVLATKDPTSIIKIFSGNS